MKLIITCLFIYLSLTSFSQTDTSTNYLFVRIGMEYDNTSLKNYYLINAERGCDNAREIYDLKAYNNKKKAINEGGVFYPAKKDSVYPYFNYFNSATEILNYMAKNGWGLLIIHNEMTTNRDDWFPLATAVGTRPLFCFKK
jgi:hypothetical protein